ncbi:MAG: ABC transporter permease [Acidobacteriota bacterium]|nr:ABC transporter permease [Acidobacteriota bacterium]
MAIPLKYNLRNLIVRRTTTLMTALSITLTIAVFVIMMALAGGMETALTATGNPLNILVMREGSQSEVVSFVSHENYQIVRYLHGIAIDKNGNPIADPEEVILVAMKRIGQEHGSNVTVRGVGSYGPELRPEFHLAAGRMFRPGMREVIVSKKISERFQDCALGDKIKFAKGYWTVVGIFDAGRSAYNSEIWTNVDDLAADFDRPDYSEVVVRAQNAGAVQEIAQQAKNDRRLHLMTETELAYYQSQTSSAAPIKAFAIFIAVLMAVGASFAAMNTMYAAVARRTKEIGTLRAVGFSRRSVLASFVLESVVIAFVGGLIGCLAALPVNWVTTGTINFSTFSEITFNFNVTPQLFIGGLVFAVVMGLFGGFFPAWRASHESIVTALRS